MDGFLSAILTVGAGVAAFFGFRTLVSNNDVTADSINRAIDALKVRADTKITGGSAIVGNVLTRAEVRALAEKITGSYFKRVDPMMLRAMAEIESSRDRKAYRWESQLGEPSIGLMQTLVSTAKWLAADMGYNKYGVPSEGDLYNPEISMYFAAAYVNWLRRYGSDEEKLVRNYNGGTKGYQINATLNHWIKYQKAKARLVAYDGI